MGFASREAQLPIPRDSRSSKPSAVSDYYPASIRIYRSDTHPDEQLPL
jgi:hypothetical protein